MSVGEDGVVRVEMVPEPNSLRTGWMPPPELPGFVAGEDFLRRLARGGVVRHDLSSHNPCTGLMVETPQGVFRTDDVAYYLVDEVLGVGIRSMTFRVGQSTFESADAGEPEYWVLPLTNFLSECPRWHPELDRHPLRIFPTPEVPDEVATVLNGTNEEQRRRDEWRAMGSLLAANGKNKLIVFEFGEDLGFVERLSEYPEISQMLLDGEAMLKITAVMVGPTGGEPVESFDAMRGWFSFDVLSLLTLATGTEVGSPWVEVRDGEGRLVRRLHARLDVKAFRRGYRLIPEIPMARGRGFKATGRLIECARGRSRKFGEAFVRVILKILGFDGGYSPRVIPYLRSFPVGWVKPGRPARALGYRK